MPHFSTSFLSGYPSLGVQHLGPYALPQGLQYFGSLAEPHGQQPPIEGKPWEEDRLESRSAMLWVLQSCTNDLDVVFVLFNWMWMVYHRLLHVGIGSILMWGQCKYWRVPFDRVLQNGSKWLVRSSLWSDPARHVKTADSNIRLLPVLRLFSGSRIVPIYSPSLIGISTLESSYTMNAERIAFTRAYKSS